MLLEFGLKGLERQCLMLNSLAEELSYDGQGHNDLR